MAKRPALGKGIGALLNSATQEGGRKYFLCPIEELKPHSKQPRKTFNDEKMAELVASVKEKGVIQPLVVRRVEDSYQIIAGERRWRAAQKAGLREIPVVIQDVSEDWALEVALIENIQREDLNPIEEAEAYRNLMDGFDLSQEEVARRVGKDRSTVANSLRLLRLPDPVRDDVLSSRLTMGHARSLLSLESDEDIVEARNQVLEKKLSVRETEALVKKIKSFGVVAKPKTKQVENPELVHLAGELKRALGTQVKISAKGKGGKIEITYFSPQELERLMEVLGLTL
ncbi:MAG: ParB/RepB/Spo0J family partition protein [Desulfuromonadales bacterium]|uniref:ParB/RepB/Spo0J family partition protein n=1 Tax=Desulfuromonas sp. KJ2020 TaxID=2919173 RepID=UPI0003239FC8|nr:ParB/RepB/Spo0J family partition protein [Desulfuromonas sp. KJ2020]MCP3176177.1 ParB/RepB/Spo0J family partition protein [Desulfuromonas sp. KJ2020]